MENKMKKIAITLSCLALLATATGSFAAMKIEGRSDGVISDPVHPFEGKITFVSYYHLNENQPRIQVDVDNDTNERISVVFSDADLPVGMSLFNAIGKPLIVEFADANFNVSGLFTYQPGNGAISAFQKAHHTIQSKK
jgi:hypothetical protein